jgi:hypothetical protein
MDWQTPFCYSQPKIRNNFQLLLELSIYFILHSQLRCRLRARDLLDRLFADARGRTVLTVGWHAGEHRGAQISDVCAPP